MKTANSKIRGKRFIASDGAAGKVDDLFFDVRTGDVTHISVALNGWYRGNIVLIRVDSCSISYDTNGVAYPEMSIDAVRKAPLLDDETARNAKISELLINYEDANPCWSLSGRCCVTQTRSEAIEEKTGQPALWATRDLAKAPVLMGNGKKLGVISDLLIDTDTWHITHLLVRQGSWFRPAKVEVPIDFLSEVDNSGNAANVVLNADTP